MTNSGLFFSAPHGGRRVDTLAVGLGVGLPVGIILLLVVAYLVYRSRRDAGGSNTGDAYKAQALNSDDPLEKLSAEMEFGQASLFQQSDNEGRRNSVAGAGNKPSAAASATVNGGGHGPNMPDSGKPLDLGLGSLFPTEKTPQVMTNSVAKGMQEARVNGVMGNGNGHGHGVGVGGGGIGAVPSPPLVPQNLDMGASRTPPKIPAIVPEGHENDIQGLQESDRMLGGVIGQAQAAAAPLAPRPPLAPRSGMGNALTPKATGTPVAQKKIADAVLGNSFQTKKSGEFETFRAQAEGVAGPEESADGVLHWRDATVIDDTPLQKQFEDFMNQIGKVPTHMPLAKKKKPPLGKKTGSSPGAMVGEGASQFGTDASHQSATIVGSGLGQSPRIPAVDDPASIQRRRVMDLHKQMFDGQHHISDPLELPGDKGVSYYQGASSLQGRMTSGESLNKKPQPVPTEIRDEDEMWG